METDREGEREEGRGRSAGGHGQAGMNEKAEIERAGKEGDRGGHC